MITVLLKLEYSSIIYYFQNLCVTTKLNRIQVFLGDDEIINFYFGFPSQFQKFATGQTKSRQK